MPEAPGADAPTADWYPRELYSFFIDTAEVPEEEFIIDETVRRLQERGITQEWQFGLAPESMIQQAFPTETHSRHLLAAMYAKRKIAERERTQRQAEDAAAAERARAAQSGPPDQDSATARAILLLAREQRAQRRQRTRGRGGELSDSEDDDPLQDYNCAASLAQYHLSSFPTEHLPRHEKMETTAKKAARSFRTRGNFVASGKVLDYAPKWATVPKEVNSLEGHAKWVAAYWGRALAQLSAQGSAQSESVSLRDIIVQFLNANKIASESSNRVAWNYDDEIWQTLSDRIKRHETNIPVQAEFCKVSADMQLRIKSKLDREKATSSSSTDAYGKGASKSKSKTQKGKDTKSKPSRETTRSTDKGSKGKGKGGKGQGKQQKA